MVEFGVMPATGGEVTTVTTEPVAAIGTAEFSPDGRTLMVDANVDLVPSVVVVDLEARTMRTLDIGVPAERPSFRPPDGGEIMFASRVGDETFDVYLANADGSDLRKLYASTDEAFVFDKPLFSPDGSQIAFSIWDAAAERARAHVINADGTGLRAVVPSDPASTADPVWSPDGRLLAVNRWFERDGPYEIAFLDPSVGTITETDVDVTHGAAKEWAPDGTRLFVSPNDEQDKPLPQVLVDPVDGTFSLAPWTGRSYPSWQRLAP
jgi:Tol biopolymer transport system component